MFGGMTNFDDEMFDDLEMERSGTASET